ncbi:MAG: hypothetical protein LC793_15485 [Thermomicrobia bacterium]|nr:hypothetical protein [Thermomicrobia bacterium]
MPARSPHPLSGRPARPRTSAVILSLLIYSAVGLAVALVVFRRRDIHGAA